MALLAPILTDTCRRPAIQRGQPTTPALADERVRHDLGSGHFMAGSALRRTSGLLRVKGGRSRHGAHPRNSGCLQNDQNQQIPRSGVVGRYRESWRRCAKISVSLDITLQEKVLSSPVFPAVTRTRNGFSVSMALWYGIPELAWWKSRRS